MTYVINISIQSLEKEYIKCKMLVLQKDVLYPCSQSARLTLQQSRRATPTQNSHLKSKQIPTETRLCLLSTDSAPGWAKCESRVTKHFFQFLVNREFWLKSRTLLLLCVSYTCHIGSQSVQQTLVPPSVNVTLGRASGAPR